VHITLLPELNIAILLVVLVLCGRAGHWCPGLAVGRLSPGRFLQAGVVLYAQGTQHQLLMLGLVATTPSFMPESFSEELLLVRMPHVHWLEWTCSLVLGEVLTGVLVSLKTLIHLLLGV
jgi:hypothetical protein